MVNQCNQFWRAPPDWAVTMNYREDLAAVRKFVRRQAALVGLPARRVGDLVLAASEVAANTLAHTEGGGRVCVWPRHGTFICEFSDSGTIGDQQAGQVRPSGTTAGGLGLWVVRQVCDAVDIRSRPGGTTIRLCMSLAGR
jgi:anti-sigma regulatory factor (Ser/Thr protein kinase)